MANENKWEYDYSNLYRQNGPTAAGYPNTGSSGTNMANQYGAQQAGAPTGGVNFGAPQPPAGPAGVYNAPGAGYTNGTVPPSGPAAAQAAGMPGQKKPPKQKGGHGAGARAVTLVLALAVGFGGGMAGGYVAGLKNGGTKVITQTVERDTSAASATTTSTDGNNLSVSEVSALVAPSVVVITTEEMVTTGGWYGQSQVVSGAGSGVVMSADGYIMTCAHVISGASHITVTIGETNYDATVIGTDSESDIAVIKIDASGLTPAVMGDSDGLAVGEQVVAVGNPLGELGGTVTEGIVSALNRDVVVEDQEMNLIQTSASVSPGNSGGGLFNMAGELIGIVNAKSSDTSAEGLGFAIPINAAYKVAQDLIETGYVSGRPAMGITVVTIDNDSAAAQYGVSTYGVYVYAIDDNSPAAKAGLQVGDRIISINDAEVTQSSDLTGAIANCAVGDTVTLTIARSGKTMNVSVTLGEKTASTTTDTSGQNADEQQPDAQQPQGGQGQMPGNDGQQGQ
jgi:serine protease Do